MDSFAQWIRYVFDHPPVGREQREWYWGDGVEAEHEKWSADASTNVRRMTRLLQEPGSLAPFSRAQVAQGLWFLLGPSPADFDDDILAGEVALDLRLGCIGATPGFFEAYVARECLQQGWGEHEDDLATVCFMWWDLWLHGLHWAPSEDTEALIDAVLKALCAIGAGRSVACIESALHGLNHLHEYAPQLSEAAVDALLRGNQSWPPKLIEYAQGARHGAWR